MSLMFEPDTGILTTEREGAQGKGHRPWTPKHPNIEDFQK
jgi:hypothetical protein